MAYGSEFEHVYDMLHIDKLHVFSSTLFLFFYRSIFVRINERIEFLALDLKFLPLKMFFFPECGFRPRIADKKIISLRIHYFS